MIWHAFHGPAYQTMPPDGNSAGNRTRPLILGLPTTYGVVMPQDGVIRVEDLLRSPRCSCA